MRKFHLFSAVLSLFLLVPASITWAQIIKTLNGIVRYESGMSKSTLTTPNGDVVINLPQSLSGAIITGTVSTEPAGKTEKEKNKNLKELLKYVVKLDGQQIPLSAKSTNFDWLTHLDRQPRTSVELLNIFGAKLAELSLPPVLPEPATGVWQPYRTPLMTTPSNVLVKGDALNIYTGQQFKPGEKFILTDSKGQQFTLTPICLSSQQAVMNIPESVVPGNCTIREEEANQPLNNNNVSSVNFKMIDIDLSSPNTNLQSGQTSSVTVLCHESSGSGITANERELFLSQQQVLNIDLRNLNPNTVSMDGGNLQRISFPVSESQQDAAPLQIARTITGIKPGSFSVSATLHEDYNTSNDPFRPQLNVLKTPEDFNAWANALKKDLKQFSECGSDDEVCGDCRLTNIDRAIKNMPFCSDPEQLDESKAVAYSLIQPLKVPKGAANTWLSSFEVFKSLITTFSGSEEISKLFHFNLEIVEAGLDFMERISYRSNDPSTTQEVTNAREIINETGESKENHNQLNKVLNSLSSQTDQKLKSHIIANNIWTLSDLLFSTYCFNKRTKDGIDPMHSMIGFLDPNLKILRAVPEYQQQILNSLNAVPLGNGNFRIKALSETRVPVSYNIQLMPIIVGHIYDGEWWTEHMIDQRKKDTKAGSIITSAQDSTGTWYIFYKDAECVKGTPAEKITTCYPHEVFEYDEKTQKGEFVKDGKYFNFEFLSHGSCKKGNNFCTEMLQVFRIDYIYADKNCTKLIEILKTNGFSCL